MSVSHVQSGDSGECSPVTNSVGQVVCLDSMLLVSAFLIQENSLPGIDLLIFISVVFICVLLLLYYCIMSVCVWIRVYVYVHVCACVGGVFKAA